jgi:hypothetical protein
MRVRGEEEDEHRYSTVSLLPIASIMLMHLILRFKVAMQSLSHSFVPLINALTMCRPRLGLVALGKMSISTRYLKNSTHHLK